MFADIMMLAVSLGLILLACTVFTNGIELLGSRLGMHQAATGSVLAAIGTALPETIIPIVAIVVYRDAAARQVGIGAIMGAPFMLTTLAFFVTGAAVFAFAAGGRRTRLLRVDPEVVGRDLSRFLLFYTIAILAAFVHVDAVRVAIAMGLLLAYGWYVRQTIAAAGHANTDMGRLHLSRLLNVGDHGFWIALQVAGSLVLMVYGAHLFVGHVKSLAMTLGMSATILSILVTPVATELPEKLNSVIWIRQRKDTLALGNITGAMVFQSSLPVAVGILFTPWDLHGAPLISALLALASAALVLVWLRRRRSLSPLLLLAGALFYAVFIVYVFS